MSVEIAQKKIALQHHREEARYLLNRFRVWADLGHKEIASILLVKWSAHMHYCKKLKREISEAEGHHQAKERAFNGKFYPKS